MVQIDGAPKLLIADDDVALRETLSLAFSQRGFDTLTAGDGDEAIAVLDTEPVHLLLVDLHMPRVSGLETLRFLPRLASPPPAILMSGELTRKVIEEAKLASVFSVLAKPLRYRELAHVVREAMKTSYDWPGPS